MNALKHVLRELLIAAHRDTGESKIPDCLLMGGSRRWSTSTWSNGKLRRHPGNPPCPAESRQQVEPIPTPTIQGTKRCKAQAWPRRPASPQPVRSWLQWLRQDTPSPASWNAVLSPAVAAWF